jgi:hercynine metabolism small protein
MSKSDQRAAVRGQREKLIKELMATYMVALDQLASLDLPDRTIAKLAQLMIRSRDTALQIMNEEIEAPLITSAPTHRYRISK